jgi:hypothetical protein
MAVGKDASFMAGLAADVPTAVSRYCVIPVFKRFDTQIGGSSGDFASFRVMAARFYNYTHDTGKREGQTERNCIKREIIVAGYHFTGYQCRGSRGTDPVDVKRAEVYNGFSVESHAEECHATIDSGFGIPPPQGTAGPDRDPV